MSRASFGFRSRVSTYTKDWMPTGDETSSLTKGYVAGGIGSAYVATTDKYAFSDDSRSTLGTGLPAAVALAAGYGNTVSGYVAAGYNAGTFLSAIRKLVFATDVFSTLTATTSSSRYRVAAGPMNSTSAGYIAGGVTSSLDGVNTVDKMAFADESVSTLGTGLSGNLYASAAFSSSSHGYNLGGYSRDSGARISTIYKFAFSDDARTTSSATLSGVRREFSGNHSSTHGYTLGGDAATDVVDKIAFADDTRSSLSTGLSSTRTDTISFASTASIYSAGGTDGSTGNKVSTVEKFAFSNDTRSSVATGLSSARGVGAGLSGWAT